MFYNLENDNISWNRERSLSDVRVEKECELWVHLESKRYSRVGSNAEKGPDEGTSVRMAIVAMSHSACLLGQRS